MLRCSDQNCYTASPGGENLIGYSTSVGEYAYEDSKLKAGAFTAALIEGLSGKADFNGDGKIETDEMGVWLRKRVPELTEQKQHPLRHQSAPVDYTMANH